MLSIVAPVFKEEALIHEFLDRCLAVAARIPEVVEIVVVDDGSTDGTRTAIESRIDNPSGGLGSVGVNISKVECRRFSLWKESM
jgi:glycosyltransferase involved in cell wall biosynthesis